MDAVQMATDALSAAWVNGRDNYNANVQPFAIDLVLRIKESLVEDVANAINNATEYYYRKPYREYVAEARRVLKLDDAK